MASLATLRARLDRLEQQITPVTVFVKFERDPAAFFAGGGRVFDIEPMPQRRERLENLLRNHSRDVRTKLERVLEGVPGDLLQAVYELVLPTLGGETPERTRVHLEELLAKHTGDVRKTLELVLEGVPDQDLQAVYERAVGTAVAAARRGQGESPSCDLCGSSTATPDGPGRQGHC
jgi:hypothetical protein